MIKREAWNRVFMATSLSEIQSIEKSCQASNHRVLRLLVRIYLWLANALVCLVSLALLGRPRALGESPSSMLVYCAGTLGDNAVMLPAIAALKKRFPGATLLVLVNAAGYTTDIASSLLSGCPFIDHLSVLTNMPVRRSGLKLKTSLPPLPIEECDLFVDLSSFGNRGLLGMVIKEIVLARRFRPKRAVGFRVNTCRAWGPFKRVHHCFLKNEPRRSQSVLNEISLAPLTKTDVFPCNEKVKAGLRETLGRLGVAPDGNICILNPGAKFMAQCWPPERFGEAALILKRRFGFTAVINATKAERGIAALVVGASKGQALRLADDVTIPTLIELIRMSSLCLTNDTGPMHIAAMMGKPTVAVLNTRISPSHWFPWGERTVSLFAFTSGSYSYQDRDTPDQSLLPIRVENVMEAVDRVMGTATSANKSFVTDSVDQVPRPDPPSER